MSNKKNLVYFISFFLSLLLIFLSLLLYFPKTMYYVTVKRLSDRPILSSEYGQSEFRFNYNCGLFPTNKELTEFALAVRSQNLKGNTEHPYDVDPSYIIFVKIDPNDVTKVGNVEKINTMVWPNKTDTFDASYGAEDPRIVLYDGKYYLFYTAVHEIQNGLDVRLSLAVCDQDGILESKDENFRSCFKMKGPIFDDNWTKSGALLINENDDEHLLLFGDKQIEIAETNDLLNYKRTGEVLFGTRQNHFDSYLVESGPEPLPLSDGNYLFLYNSAREVPDEEVFNLRNYKLVYNIGYVVLSKDNPRNVISRSNNPIMSPETSFEKCDYNSNKYDLTSLMPNVIFVEGWRKLEENKFLMYYQGCDSVINVASVDVEIQYVNLFQYFSGDFKRN